MNQDTIDKILEKMERWRGWNWDEYKEHMTAYLNSLKDDWISVEDELPKDNTKCIVVGDGLSPQIGLWLNESWANHIDMITSRVTHWQPLPAPPTSGRKEGKL